jgi:hypothetical protein
MTRELSPASKARRRGPLRVFLFVVGGVIGGLLLLAGIVVLLFTVRNVKAKRDAQPVFAQMDSAFGRVQLPKGYAVVRSDRQGGYYNLFGYQAPGEFRVYAVPRGSRVADELMAAIEAAGFSIDPAGECRFWADRGQVTLYVEFHRNPAESIDIIGSHCSPEMWPHVYVWIAIMAPPPDGYGT